MTLYVKTKSHGDVESGFLSTFTKLSRLGKYAFETKDLCDLAQCIARDSNIKELRIHAYPEETFWNINGAYMNTVKLLEDYSSEDINLFKRQNQGEMSLEEKTGVMDEGISVSVKIEKDAIKIGEYLISDFQFGLMVVYLARGGWLRWTNEEHKPDFAEPTLLAIKKSKNEFYKRLQGFLKS